MAANGVLDVEASGLAASRRSPRLTARLARARADVALFLGAASILALHAAVDSYLAPEPGTGPGDHVLRGTATFAVLALAALAYPRLSAGGRAALSATFGVLAL